MIRSSYEELIRPDVREMEPYTPILPFEVLSKRLGRRPESIIKLDANENLYGPSPLVRERLADFPYYHIYPDPQQEQLRAALADYVGIPAKHILPGHGADELIDLLSRLFLRPGDIVINAPPTFGMYEFDAHINMGTVIQVRRDARFQVDVEGIIQAVTRENRPGLSRVKLLFLTSPNNPDGGLLSAEALEELLNLPLLVVVDEAYIEFAGHPSLASRVPERENLVVLRTFSKWAGIAGLRLGYGLFPEWLMPHLWRFKQPYNVNVAATVAGLAALEDRAYYAQTTSAIVSERERLYQALLRIPYLHPYPSRANFILCRVEGMEARELKEQLAREGILVRYFHKPGLENCIRISAGKPEHTDRLLAALANARA
jgi:histidinol-phosphate aminotransferase